jgi:CheY-like chemotaxis protein
MDTIAVPTLPRVLLVDQDADHRYLLQELLRELLPCAVDEAAAADQALAQVQARRPDLIVLDYQIPPLGALAFLHTLHARFDALPTPVLVLSDSQQVEDRHCIEGTGAYWLAKPYNLDDLELAVYVLLTSVGWARFVR